MEATARHGVPMVASSGYVAQIDEAVCEACASCKEICPFEAIQVRETAVVNWGPVLGVECVWEGVLVRL